VIAQRRARLERLREDVDMVRQAYVRRMAVEYDKGLAASKELLEIQHQYQVARRVLKEAEGQVEK